MTVEREPARPEDERAAWEAIVADLTTDPVFRSTDPGAVPPTAAADDEPVLIPELPDVDDDPADAFLPPEPPPIPRPADTVARFAWAGVIGGPVLLVADYALSLGRFVSGVAIVMAIGGFVTLVARRREHSPDERWGEDHFGDGAIR
jgi:hypothetical protein